MLTYTNIQHDFRKANELSCNEYVLLDMVYHLSVNPKNKLGWCYASKKTLGEEIGLSRQSIIDMINRLCERGFMVRHEETAHLRTTKKWYSVYTCKETLQGVNLDWCKETLHPPVKKLYTPCKETLHNNDINNNKEIIKESLSISEKLNFISNPENQKEKEEKGGRLHNTTNELNYTAFSDVVRNAIKIDSIDKKNTYITNLGIKPSNPEAANILEAIVKNYIAIRFKNVTEFPYLNTDERAQDWAVKRCTFADFNAYTLSQISIGQAQSILNGNRKPVTQKEEGKEDKNKRLLELLKKNQKLI